jgi:hypothetical protein
LIRGNTVVVADSFGQADLRGAKLIVASKGLVRCNRKGRCAGTWCIGKAVFVTSPNTNKDDKHMGWRSGTNKICLTHLKDEEGNLILPPQALRVMKEALDRPLPQQDTPIVGPVTWDDLANTVSERDWVRLTTLARRLKRENEVLQQRVIEVQDKLIEHLNTRV